MKKKVFNICALFISVCLLSCNSNTTVPNNDFKINSLSSEPMPSVSIDPQLLKNLKPLIPGEIDKSKVKTINMGQTELFNKPTFDGYPEVSSKSNEIVIIYRDSYYVRVDKKQNKILDNNKFDYSLLMNLLNSYKLVKVSDFSTGDQRTDDETEARSTQYYQTDIPNNASLHHYEFPVGTNTDELCRNLRALPFVLTAYPKPTSLTFTAATNLAKQTSASYSGNKPTTNWYNSPSSPETTHWWWYNMQRTFQGWDYYKSFYNCSGITNCNMPVIAVIDSAFNTYTNDSDKPNYLTGVYVDKYNNQIIGDTQPVYDVTDTYPIISTFPNPIIKIYHGDVVASVASNPGDIKGAAPGAQIYPIRIETAYGSYHNGSYYPSSRNFNSPNFQAMANAIDIAISKPNIDVINISASYDTTHPLTYDYILRQKVSNAIAAGKIVVLSAGNNQQPINDSTTNWNSWDVGEIIVGGSEFDSTGLKKPKAWSGLNSGTAYDSLSSRIDLVAGAKDIYIKSLNVENTQRIVVNVSGTSFAAPQVAAAAGMVKKIASNNGINLSPRKVRDILTMSSSLGRFGGGYPTPNPTPPSSPTPPPSYAESRFLGRNLDISSNNPYLAVSLRSLNLYNALVIAKNLNNYSAIVRAFNIDNSVWASINYDWGNGYLKGLPDAAYGDDTIYGLTSLSNGTNLTFITCNDYAGGYALGYQVLNANKAKNPSNANAPWSEYIAGLSGFVGASNNELTAATCLNNTTASFLYYN